MLHFLHEINYSTKMNKTSKSFQSLMEITQKLRDPKIGCPWDKEQTITTLQKYMKEESEEVFEAIKNNDMENLKEELGDLFFNVILMSYVAEQEGKFTVQEVIESISKKLVRRHPHVFGNKKCNTSEEVLKQWKEIKKNEKNQL